MNRLVFRLMLWLLPVVLGLVGRHLAQLFSGSCPGSPEGFLCSNWPWIAGIGGAVLGALGFPVAKKVEKARLEQRRNAIRVVPDPLPPRGGIPVTDSNGAQLVDSNGTPITTMSPDDPDWDRVHDGGG